jgi:pyrroloquinoline quinone (PQQ) biosynthesis protein C
MGFYAELLAATAIDRDRFSATAVLRDGASGRITRAEYLAFLGEAYHHVRHTVPLLMACGARLPARLEWLRNAVAEYIEEELGHQEWILDDIRHAGGEPERVRGGQPGAATELMVAYAWDTVQRRNPAGFFGMVLVLEGTSVALATRAADAIEAGLALPRNAFSYLRSHGDLDQAHIGFYEGLMDRIDDPEDRVAIVHAARMFYRLYGDVYRSLRPAGIGLAEAA